MRVVATLLCLRFLSPILLQTELCLLNQSQTHMRSRLQELEKETRLMIINSGWSETIQGLIQNQKPLSPSTSSSSSSPDSPKEQVSNVQPRIFPWSCSMMSTG
uniref:Uncharacterized protein n=1 Tax=Nelumbo nucifera TaxID=4432 RepID=A0A822XS82_NELNU|nr:TPA_asm: hypothetical protein HUJ06_023138 [Nelumbo nucifera]